MPSYAITGASRGIGYALLKQLSADPANTVISIVRSVEPAKERVAKEFPDRKNIHFVYGELTNLDSLKAAAKEVASITGGGLDVLIANAALQVMDVYPPNSPKFDWPDFDRAALDSFKTNALGNIHLIALFVPLIQKGNLKKVVAVSSGMADIDFIRQSGNYAQTPYSMSKAALNLAMAKFHAQYAPEGILFMTLSPGLVDTPKSDIIGSKEDFENGVKDMMATMGAYAAKVAPDFTGPITPEESAKMSLDVIDKATIEENGGIMVSHHGNQKWL